VIERRIAARGPASIFNFSGLERGLPLEASELALADDEVAPALAARACAQLTLEHLGRRRGAPRRHDLQPADAATFATHLALVAPGDAVLGLSPSYTHPTAIRSARQCGARFVETGDLAGLAAALEREPRVPLVVLTRLAVTYTCCRSRSRPRRCGSRTPAARASTWTTPAAPAWARPSRPAEDARAGRRPRRHRLDKYGRSARGSACRRRRRARRRHPAPRVEFG